MIFNETPFGLPDCESEVEVLRDRYSEIFFDATPFNAPALRPSSYLIVGRRGSGKTALAQYFTFQNKLRNAICIDVDEPAVYQEVLIEISRRATMASEVLIPNLVKVWEFVIWSLIFKALEEQDSRMREALAIEAGSKRPADFINEALGWLVDHVLPDNETGAFSKLRRILERDNFVEARKIALSLAKKRPVIIAIDTLEKYDLSNNHMMQAMSALVQCAADLSLRYSDYGIHIKVFLAGEVFPHLRESFLLNPAKSIRKEPVLLLWRPRDLLRLISWRLYKFLEARDLLLPESKGEKIDWDNHHKVLQRMWTPYFGKEIVNNRGLSEETWPYVLRHTQMRPRQLITLCNSMADYAAEARRFPHFDGEDIRNGIKTAETSLATEIFNSYSTVYPGISKIADALMNMPMLFPGSEIDKRARMTKLEWPAGMYSLNSFRQLVVEVGIVGRVSRQNPRDGFIDADFQYSLADRLPITSSDECVVHPMFYSRLNVVFNQTARVMPFSSGKLLEGI